MPDAAFAAQLPVSGQLLVALGAVAVLLALAGLGVATARRPAGRPLVYGGALAVTLLAGLSALTAIAAPAAGIVLPLGIPWIGAHLRLDALSAVFLAVINLGGAAASLYGLGYGRHDHAPERVLPFFPAFLAGMNMVLLADDAYSFLLSWEFMSLASWALVVAHDKEAGNVRAGLVYILMASFGTLALMLAFGLLAAGSGGGYAFDAMREAPPVGAFAALALALALLGAGSKAGLVPLHVWLPLAHPAAPSHVSALMSGVMTKVAVYGFIRIVFDLSGPPDWWWGIPVLGAGGVAAVIGVLQALLQGDTKRVLAYSTIENIGLIFIGLGLALAFSANGFPTAAALALTAALFHVLNHAAMKSLLFFGAGAVLTATGTRQMEELGGLIHRMPTTSVVMLIGCAAISALPPLNGFASEWLVFQAVLLSPELPVWGLKLMVPAVGALMALAAALAAACFVRLYGIAFLGRPRSPKASEAHEVDAFSRAAMIALAAVCVGAGLLPGFVIDVLQPAVGGLVGQTMPAQGSVAWLSIIPVAESRSSYNGLLVFAFTALSALLAAFVIHRFASGAVRRAPPWDCGFPNASPLSQYSAASFAQPIRRVFARGLFAAREKVEMPPPGALTPARFSSSARDPAWAFLFLPLTAAVDYVAERANRLQYLTIRQYLGLVFSALVLLLLVLALWT
ncbi:hydrogenase 4 subunit B [Xanthobacter versatilis]|uniref:hydrogenase 4 subunit B n=1 Tax=Xanthobacter autotrophicus (strain ATCC BAA-1158 / Py2) TaxID=78245 RepID=UPI00372C91BC